MHRRTLRPTVDQRCLLAVILFSCVFLYLQVFVLPSTPRLATGDQAIYLNNALRMLRGELIYRDYDHFTLPGTDVLYMSLFKLFGVKAWIPQAMLIILGTCNVWLILGLSRKIMRGVTSYLPALLFIILPFSSYLDATHHWYSTLFTTAALYILIERTSLVRLALSGMLLGIATFFTQSVGLLGIGFALFVAWEHRQQKLPRKSVFRKEAFLLLSYLATVAASIAYFAWQVGLRQILYHTVVFVVKYYPADWFNNWRVYLTGRPQIHTLSSWVDLPAFGLIHLLIPLIYVMFLMLFAQRSRLQPGELRNRLMLINLSGLFLFFSVASAPAYSRLYAVSIPALVLLVWLLDSSGKMGYKGLQLLWTTVLILAIVRPLVIQFRWKAYLDLPTGRTAFFEPVLFEKCKWVSERTRPSDYFFGDHLIAFTLTLRNVGRVPFLRPTDYTRPEEVQDAIQALEKFQVRFVSWYHGLDYEKDAARRPQGNHLASIRLYLREHYHLAQTFSNGDEMWERNR